jgi:hypothetical protein
MIQSMEDKIREYRTAASQKQAVKARAQAERDQASERLLAAREVLKMEFGVTTLAEAKELQTKLNADLAAAEAEIEAAFAEAGA